MAKCGSRTLGQSHPNRREEIIIPQSNTAWAEPHLPIKLKALVTLIHAKPCALSDASARTGAASFFAAETVMKAARINVTHVPYRGGDQALTALLSREVPVYLAPSSTRSTAQQLLRSTRLTGA